MSTRSGELVIISGVKIKLVPKFLKSLRVRIAFVISLFVVLACVFLRMGILNTYEQRSVAVRTAEIQNQCTILANQLVNSHYLEDTGSDVINAELSQ